MNNYKIIVIIKNNRMINKIIAYMKTIIIQIIAHKKVFLFLLSKKASSLVPDLLAVPSIAVITLQYSVRQNRFN